MTGRAPINSLNAAEASFSPLSAVHWSSQAFLHIPSTQGPQETPYLRSTSLRSSKFCIPLVHIVLVLGLSQAHATGQCLGREWQPWFSLRIRFHQHELPSRPCTRPEILLKGQRLVRLFLPYPHHASLHILSLCNYHLRRFPDGCCCTAACCGPDNRQLR